MDIVSMKELLVDAYKKGYAVPAINVSNMETVMAVMEKASDMKSPIILQVAPMQLENQNINYEQIVDIIKIFSKSYDGKCAIHEDHSESLQYCYEAIKGGFTSIMFDGSKLSYEENVKNTKLVTDICSKLNISVEAELGKIMGNEASQSNEGDTAIYTDVHLAKDFVSKTKVDALAVSIGNAHGFYKGKPKLDFDRLRELKESIDIPMVLHGGTGIPCEDIQKSVKLGISKVNFFTEIDNEFTNAFKNQVLENEGIYMMSAIEKARQAMMAKVEEKIKVCMAEGRI
ncbi:ketose-bisphosphate aldolase [Haloimpatiens sp. FM7330]|uniref:class II fructose-bisphosphate aldolase n=1 Tax=Haloimpatiens sp. FM7330 TaxID=3298610 RepID=UPI003624FD73